MEDLREESSAIYRPRLTDRSCTRYASLPPQNHQILIPDQISVDHLTTDTPDDMIIIYALITTCPWFLIPCPYPPYFIPHSGVKRCGRNPFPYYWSLVPNSFHLFPIPSMNEIQSNILSRYEKNGRKLPRRETTDPYAIHISEVMLQQTQVERVIPYFHRWMESFPDYETLAKASKTELLSHRSGLGFNSRAVRLQQCSQTIIEKWRSEEWKEGFLPEERELLQKLPGIGPYTSAAIMAFAWNISVPVIDTNIRRVLIFLFKLPETITAKALEDFAETIIPKGRSRDWHNALMDQWALLLTARKTKIKPLSKQSKFEWSDRQVRWWTMKQLVKHGTIAMPTIEEEFPHKQVKKIIKELQQEGLIKLKRWTLTIAE